MINWSRLEKRTCLSSTCYRPSMVSNVFPDQSFSPCHHREIICSYIQTPTAPAVPRRYSFYAECPSLPSTVGFSTTPFSDCTPSSPKSPTSKLTPTSDSEITSDKSRALQEDATAPASLQSRMSRNYPTHTCPMRMRVSKNMVYILK